ncbi:MAG: ribonuclease P protein component 4 [Thermoproteota archaeon]
MDDKAKRIALNRVEKLFSLARELIHSNPELAQRYVDIARKLAMRVRLRLPREYRRQICRQCKRFILPGVNCRVRIRQNREPHVVITCLNCGNFMRFPSRKEKEKRKDE